MDTSFGSKHRIEAFSLITNVVGCGATSRRDGEGAYSKDRCNKGPPGFRGGRQFERSMLRLERCILALLTVDACCRLCGMS